MLLLSPGYLANKSPRPESSLNKGNCSLHIRHLLAATARASAWRDASDAQPLGSVSQILSNLQRTSKNLCVRYVRLIGLDPRVGWGDIQRPPQVNYYPHPLSNERQKSPIEKRKRNLKKYSPISRRERERDFIFSIFERRTRNSKYKFCKYEINFRSGKFR